MARAITSRYEDPLDVIWTATARLLGLSVLRDDSVYASWDGRGTLTIGSPETLDHDDSLAQLIFHEICHALVQGPESQGKPDWGLENTDDRDALAEQACLRLQAALGQGHGLRRFFAATTDYRSYYDALPADPLQDVTDPATLLALEGHRRALHGPWARPLQEALQATARIAAATAPFAGSGSLWAVEA